MSNFICTQCGMAIIDSPNGYVTECEHYKMDCDCHPEPFCSLHKDEVRSRHSWETSLNISTNQK